MCEAKAPRSHPPRSMTARPTLFSADVTAAIYNASRRAKPVKELIDLAADFSGGGGEIVGEDLH